MKCQNCGHNEANFFQRSNINGYISETYLCAECVEKLGIMHRTMPRVFDEFFSSFGRMFSPNSMPFELRPATPRLAVAVPVAESAPQTPEIDENMKRRREINILREQMKAAAEAEDFEKAISLREEIKRLEA